MLTNTFQLLILIVLRSDAWPQIFLSKQVTVMSVIVFGDLLDTYEGQIFNTNERQSFMAYIENVSHSQS